MMQLASEHQNGYVFLAMLSGVCPTWKLVDIDRDPASE